MQIVGSVATINSVAVSGSSALLLSAADARKYAIVHNFSGTNVFLAFASTAGSGAGGFSVVLADGEAYEIPAVWQGDVSAITASGSGSVNVTAIK